MVQTETAAPAVSSQPAETTTRTITVLVDRLNIRTAPSTSAQSVGHAQQGAVYEYTDVREADG